MISNDNLNFHMNEVRSLTLSEVCNNNNCFKKTTMPKWSDVHPVSRKVFSLRERFPPLNLEELKTPPSSYHF